MQKPASIVDQSSPMHHASRRRAPVFVEADPWAWQERGRRQRCHSDGLGVVLRRLRLVLPAELGMVLAQLTVETAVRRREPGDAPRGLREVGSSREGAG